jgi:hypothetical protein
MASSTLGPASLLLDHLIRASRRFSGVLVNKLGKAQMRKRLLAPSAVPTLPQDYLIEPDRPKRDLSTLLRAMLAVPEQEGCPARVRLCVISSRRVHLYFIREGIACAAASVCSEEFLVQRVYRCKVFAQSTHFAPNHYKLNED